MNAFSENKTVLKLEANIFFSSMTNAPKVEGKKKQKTWPDSNLHTHLDPWCLLQHSPLMMLLHWIWLFTLGFSYCVSPTCSRPFNRLVYCPASSSSCSSSINFSWVSRSKPSVMLEVSFLRVWPINPHLYWSASFLN